MLHKQENSDIIVKYANVFTIIQIKSISLSPYLRQKISKNNWNFTDIFFE